MISEKYKDLYLSTTKQQLKKLSELLLYLEKKPSNQNLIENIFRLIHSMKGASATMSYKNTVNLLHAMESIVDAVYNSELIVDSKILNLLFDTFDVLKENFVNIDKKNKEINLTRQIKLLKTSLQKKGRAKNRKKPREKHILGSLPSVAEVTVSTDKLDDMSNNLDDLLINFMKVKNKAEDLGDVEFLKLCANNDKVLSSLRRKLEKIRIVSLRDVLSPLPYLVREIAQNEGKKVQLNIKDHDLSLDKAILDEIMEVLIQLIKNSVSHGISQKQKNAKIVIEFSLENDKMRISVFDNGGGIDWKSIFHLATKNKIVSPKKLKSMSTTDKKNLIFYAGISQGQSVDTVSGRGIGLSLVKSKIKELGGQIEIISSPQKGTEFIIDLPRPLSVFRGMIFNILDYSLALPLDYVDKLVYLDEVKDFYKAKTFTYQKKKYNLVSILNIFDIKKFKPFYKYVALINYQNKKIALPIFRQVIEEELIMKQTPLFLKDNKYIKGVAVSSKGKVVLVLDPVFS